MAEESKTSNLFSDAEIYINKLIDSNETLGFPEELRSIVDGLHHLKVGKKEQIKCYKYNRAGIVYLTPTVLLPSGEYGVQYSRGIQKVRFEGNRVGQTARSFVFLEKLGPVASSGFAFFNFEI